MHETVTEIDIQQLRVNPHQPRRYFSKEELQELADSLRSVGFIHPPLVRHDGSGGYELISGERRFQAALLAGFSKIPVNICNSDTQMSAQMALIENIQRVDLNPMEVAKALRSLIEEFGYSQEELAKRIGKKRSTVANYLRLLSLPKNIQDAVVADKITMGHAKAILSLDNFSKQNLLFDLIERDGLSVREAEEAALRIAEKAKKKKLVYVNRDFLLEQLAQKVQQALGTKVSITGKGKRGRVAIDYYNLDDLDRILALLGVGD
jgi:ParB family chromosome partitioning protein